MYNQNDYVGIANDQDVTQIQKNNDATVNIYPGNYTVKI